MNAATQLRSANRLGKLIHKARSYRKCGKIKSVKSLRRHLQTAIVIEHATIPTYLCALYSIKENTNTFAYKAIQSVVMEEMLHMLLACNILNAIGGHPIINKKKHIPTYPGYLPHSDESFKVGLLKFSPEAIDTFLDIERPAKRDACPQPDEWHTIGQFYDSIDHALNHFEEEAQEKGETIFTGSETLQLDENDYYGGGGKLFKVLNLDDANLAIKEIVGQGEGNDDTIFDTDSSLFCEEVDIAHYYKFNEIKMGRRYTPQGKPHIPPRGEKVDIDYCQVYNMHPNPSLDDYSDYPALYQQTLEFNKTYMALLDCIHDAVNGKPEALTKGVPIMFDLKYRAIALMKTPYKDGMTAGPSFEYVE